MKKLFLFLIVLTALTSCHKEHTPSPVQPGIASKKLMRIDFEESPGSNTLLSYDASGRIIGSENSDVKASVNFNGTTVSYTNFIKAQNQNAAAGIFTLENKGNAIHFELVYSLTPGTSDTDRYDYSYNADGYLAKQVVHYHDATVGEMDLEYDNGNVIKQSYISNGVLSSYLVYTYSGLEDKTGINTNFTIYTNCMGGKKTRNLPIKAEGFNAANVKQLELQYENKLDADGYLIKKTTHYVTAGTTLTNDYIYDK